MSYQGPPDAGYGFSSQPSQPAHPSGTTSEERNWAVAAHAGSFAAAYVALGFLAPLLVMLVKGKESQFIRAHAVESLNFQITALIYLAISGLLLFVLIGFVLLPLVGIFYLIVVILASIKASEGGFYRYPLTLRLVS